MRKKLNGETPSEGVDKNKGPWLNTFELAAPRIYYKINFLLYFIILLL